MPVTAGKGPEDLSQRQQYNRGGVGRWHWDRRDRLALNYVVGSRILDAGCGEGITLEKLHRQFPGAEIVGVDVDESNVVICREHGLSVRQADLNNLPYNDGRFNTCLLLEVLEHLDAPEMALTELARVTVPGGRLIIIFPVDWAMFLARVLCGRWREARFDPSHVQQWNFRQVKKLFQHCGIKTLVTQGTPLPWPLMLHGLVVGVKT